MAKIKNHDFIEIEYTGKIKDENLIFDTTYKDIAEKNNILNPEFNYGPVKILVGNRQVLTGIDRFIEGKEPGAYKVEIKAEDGFGKKNPKLFRLINTNIFLKQRINPVCGLPINMDGLNGVIKTVSGGRCIVDFNHPLAGRDLEYEIKINKILEDDKDQVAAVVEMQLKPSEYDLKINEGKAIIEIKKNIDKPIKDLIKDMIVKFTKIKSVEFLDKKLDDKK
jgi:FKBP-type peptidyl-prolyl cis-trans isomerase SlyD